MNKIIHHLYISILFFAPLAFGTTETWSRWILSTAVFACAALFFYSLWWQKRHLRYVPGLLPLLIMWGGILIQMLPLPANLVGVISPETYQLYRETAGIMGPVPWMHLSVDMKATMLQWVQFSASLLFYVLSVQLLSRSVVLRWMIDVVISFGAVMALAAILCHFSAPEKIFWLWDSFQSRPFGPYINRNHYAGFIVMLFPVTLCMLLYNKPRIVYETWRERISEFFTYRTTHRYLFLFLAVLLMGISVFVSLSRGGIVCLSLALFVLGVFMSFHNGSRRGKGVMVAVFSGVILLSVGWFGWDPIFSRFNDIRSDTGDIAEARLPAWRDSLEIIKAYPLLGTGAGTFFHAHKAFRNKTPGRGLFHHAHNDYLETAANLGLIGLTGFIAFIVTVVLVSTKRFLIRHDSYAVYLFFGAITGLAAILIHSAMDYQLQIGANALYFFFIASLCVAATHTRMRFSRHETLLPKIQREWPVPVFGGVAGLLLCFGTAVNGGAYLGELHFNNVLAFEEKEVLTDVDYQDLKERALKATLYDPLEGQNYVVLAEAEMALAEPETAMGHLHRALQINPMNGRFLQAAADLFTRNGQIELADKYHQAALKYEGYNPRTHVDYGFWLMSQNKFAAGMQVIQKALALAPELTEGIVGRLAEFDLRYDELIKALPPMAKPFIDLGAYLMAVDQAGLAQRAYHRAYEVLLASKNALSAQSFQQVCRFYLEQDQIDEAFKVVSTGVDKLPMDSGLRYTLGMVYEELGIAYRAVEEYEQAVVLNPKNRSAIKRLEYLQSSS